MEDGRYQFDLGAVPSMLVRHLFNWTAKGDIENVRQNSI